MAITLADFTKIWASTSPLTPYAFSDSNYQEGWNFIGGTPPARQMWDFIQKQNDEKMKYIVDNFLPLSGGTMTGPLLISADISSPTDDSNIGINGGTARNKGAWLSVWGKDHATYPGWFGIHANNGTDDGVLIGKPNGSLTWNNKTVITGTEYSQTFTTNKLAANAEQNFILTAQPKYWSVICNSGGGWSSLLFAVNSGKNLRITNKSTSTLPENVNFTINYIA